jgi:hypothetical protein
MTVLLFMPKGILEGVHRIWARTLRGS